MLNVHIEVCSLKRLLQCLHVAREIIIIFTLICLNIISSLVAKVTDDLGARTSGGQNKKPRAPLLTEILIWRIDQVDPVNTSETTEELTTPRKSTQPRGAPLMWIKNLLC